MAIIPSDEFPGKILAPSAAYPQGQARDVQTAADGTGTPYRQVWLNDLWGFQQAILLQSGTTPSEIPDTAETSQYLEGIKSIMAIAARENFVATFPTFLSLKEADLAGSDIVGTVSHSGLGWGRAEYLRDGRTGLTPTSGDEYQFSDATGAGFTISPATGTMWVEQFGADPTGATPNEEKINRCYAAVKASPFHGVMGCGAGTFLFGGPFNQLTGNVPIIKGAGGTMTIWFVDAANTNVFNLITKPAAVNEGFGLRNIRLLGSEVVGTYALDATLCRNGGTYEDVQIGQPSATKRGAKGMLMNSNWYMNLDGVQIRDLKGLGFTVKVNVADDGVNGVGIRGLTVNGCAGNILVEGIPTNKPVGITFYNLTCEKSIGATAMVVRDVSNLGIHGGNFEGNHSAAAAGQTTMIEADSANVYILGGLYKQADGPHADSIPMSTVNGGKIHIGGYATLIENDATFFDDGQDVSSAEINTSDFEPPTRNRFKVKLTGGQGQRYVTERVHEQYGQQTTMAWSDRINNTTVTAAVVSMDFDSSQSYEVFGFEVGVVDVTHSGTRGGYRVFNVVVTKWNSTYSFDAVEVSDSKGGNSSHGNLDFSRVGSVLTMTIRPYLDGSPLATSFRWAIGRVLTGRNDRLEIIGIL